MALYENLQWANHNANRAYPFLASASRQDQTGAIKIPDSFVTGIYVPISAGMDVEPDKFFLRTLLISAIGYNIAIGYDDGTASPPIIASVNIPVSTHVENRSYALPGVDEFDDTVGKISIGKLNDMQLLPPGIFRFDPADGALEADAIRPMIRGISSLTCVNGNDRSQRLYGDVALVAGANMRLTLHVFEDADPQIVFSAIDGEGLNEECECDNETESQPCISTINGIGGDVDGNIQLQGDACLTLSPIDNGLQLVDQCSAPCCGSDELQAVISQIDRFADGVATYQGAQNRLSAEVAQMSGVVLGSRLGDRSCITCD